LSAFQDYAARMNRYLDLWQWAANVGFAALFVVGAGHLLVLAALVRTVESLAGNRIPGLHRIGTVHLGAHGMEARDPDRSRD